MGLAPSFNQKYQNQNEMKPIFELEAFLFLIFKFLILNFLKIFNF